VPLLAGFQVQGELQKAIKPDDSFWSIRYMFIFSFSFFCA